ncbi:MAG: hypothetical protein AAFX55_15045, partial [Bacteroidota bacterium]
QHEKFFMLLMPFVALANTEIDAAKTTKERSIKKSFNVSSNATLKINNSYGNLDVITWDQNQIDFDITIKVSGNNEEKVQERLNDIDVDFSSSNDLVSAITKIGKKNKSWWNWGKKNNLKLEINYVVKMPVSGSVDLNNDYGGINLDRLEGHAKIVCDYGKITTKELMGDNNEFRFDYTNNSYFEFIKSGKINADYSAYTVAKAENLIITADYTKSTIEAAENITYNGDYGALKVENINNIEGNGDYLSVRLGNVYKNVKIRGDYGSLKIDRMASKAGNIDINSEFMGITIGYDSGYNFDFDIDLEYASLRSSEGFNFTNKHVSGSEKKYDGYHGSKGSGNIVTIKSEYGSVSFKQQ